MWSSSEEKNNITSSLSSLMPSSSSSPSSSPQECSSPAVFLEACSYDRSLCGLLSNAEKLFKWALQNTAMVQKYFWNIAAQSCAGVFLFKTEICCKPQRHFWNMHCRVVLFSENFMIMNWSSKTFWLHQRCVGSKGRRLFLERCQKWFINIYRTQNICYAG